jgi:hypothetical protein
MAKKSTAAKPAFRVIRITDSTRNTFKSVRDSAGLKKHEALERIIMLNLPQLVEGLQKLGISKPAARAKVRPIRLPAGQHGHHTGSGLRRGRQDHDSAQAADRNQEVLPAVEQESAGSGLHRG